MQTLVNWWSDYPEELLTQRVLQPLQRYLTTELVVTKKLTVSVMNTIKVRPHLRSSALVTAAAMFRGRYLAESFPGSEDCSRSEGTNRYAQYCI
jgi:hypothetical protein